eukprot:gene21508-27851_t
MLQERFSYSTQPHVAPVKTKPKYRDENENDENNSHKNIMYDARVIRGNTYAARIAATTNQTKQQQELAWKRVNPKQREINRKFIGKRGSTPPPVDGRSHMDMQTEEYLEVLSDRPIEVDTETQTQAFMDRPPSPLFVPAKIGIDVETQILTGDLFDFDLEVEPILEVLVGKTIHVAMLELLQQEELDAIRAQQEEYEAIRNIEIAEVQRLEAESRRRNDERNRRLEQELKRIEEKRFLEEKIAARGFSQQYLSSLRDNVFESLEAEGAFYDPVKREIEEIFMVDLINSVKDRINNYDTARLLADELIDNVKSYSKTFESQAITIRNQYIEEKKKEEAKLLAEQIRLKAEEEAKKAEAIANGEIEEEED